MTFAEHTRFPAYTSALTSPAGALLNAVDPNSTPLSGVLARMLDEIDYGLVLVTATGRLRYANQLALRTLAGGGGLQLAGGIVSATQLAEQAQLRSALADAARGLRRMLNFGNGDAAARDVSINAAAIDTVAIVPLSAGESPSDGNTDAFGDAEPLIMLVFGKQPVSETLTLDFFSRTHRLTGAESGVLQALCTGRRPKEIALSLGVAISTVRTQIGSIRIKTQTRSIRDLVNRIATLPPITPAMKMRACH